MHPNGSARYQVTLIPVDEIKFFVRRSRPPAAYSRLKDSIREMGLKIPISVRDIASWPKNERRRQDGAGGHYKYELICGQGRLQAFRELGIDRIPAVVHEVEEEEIVGRFLAENVMRRKLSWLEKGQLIKYDVDSGMTAEEIAKRYFITKNHVLKYLRILKGASQAVLEHAKASALSINDTEILTTLGPEGQSIVVEVLKDEGLSADSIPPLVRMAKESAKKGKLSKSELKEQVGALKRQRRDSRSKLKLYRHLHAFGPANVTQLLEIPEVRSLLDDLKVNYQVFLAGTKSLTSTRSR